MQSFYLTIILNLILRWEKFTKILSIKNIQGLKKSIDDNDLAHPSHQITLCFQIDNCYCLLLYGLSDNCVFTCIGTLLIMVNEY